MLSPDKTHMMIDIETLGVRPTSIVHSIGWVLFDMDGSEVSSEHFYLDLSLQEDLGLTFEESTLNWWKTQDSPDAFYALNRYFPNNIPEKIPVYNPKSALQILADDLQFSSGDILCKGSSFDFPILTNLSYASLGYDIFNGCYRKLTCWRTLEREWKTFLTPESLEIYSTEKAQATHNALDDAKAQVRNLILLESLYSS